MTDMHKIMIVDDDPNICEIVQVYCEREASYAPTAIAGQKP